MNRLATGVTLLMTLGIASESNAAEPLEFAAREFRTDDGNRLLYRLLVPPGYDSGDADSRHPLLIFLHGAGERGDDNQAQLKHGRAFMETMAREHGCFVLAPQCPTGQKWVDVDWSADAHQLPREPAQPMAALLKLLDKLQQEYRIDSRRLYVMGLSMGGYGVWGMIQRNPEMFAAAVPICGGGDTGIIEPIKDMPIWCFHGDQDGAVPVQRSREMIERIRKAGGHPKYTEYPGVGHNSWVSAFAEPDLPAWLLAQRRSEP